MDGKANPTPLALAAFAATTWVFGMLTAGWYSSSSLGVILALALAFGGAIQIVAGVMEWSRGNTLATTGFLAYGGFWWTAALLLWHGTGPLSSPLVGWAVLLWGVIFFIVWLAALRHELIAMLLWLFLWIAFVVLAIGAFSGASAIVHLGGYAALITAIIAFYGMAARLVNDCHGRTVIPYGMTR